MSERDIFMALTDLPTAAERAKYLDAACGGDADLRRRVEKLLGSHEAAGSFLDLTPARPSAPDHAATRAFAPDPDHAATRTGGGTSGNAEDDEALSFLTPSIRPDSLGRIGHYEVLQVLGKGGFGIVFRAFDDLLQRVVAVKVMAPQLAATSPARKRFLREARTSAQVRHENVVQVHEVAEHPLPYLVMEFIPGETLQQRLDRVGPVEPAEVVRVGRQVAEGLAAAHATDLIHRDIKPSNVLIEGGQHRVKITDFGLARAADDASISQSGIIAGTPMYMAPEQALGQKLDQRADLFSLGSVLYQMAAGRPPFRANSTVAVLKRVAEDTPRDIREIIPETPQWLCDIISKLHAKNPDERYQSAREVADVLADCEAQLKSHARLKDFSRIPRSKSQPSGRRKWAAAAAVLLLPVLVLAVTEIAGVTHLLQKQQPTVAVTPKNDPNGDPKTPVATGQFALAFDGFSNYVSIPTWKFQGDHPLTIEAWAVFKRTLDTPHQEQVISSAEQAGLAIVSENRFENTTSLYWSMFFERYRRANAQVVARNCLVHIAGVYDAKGEISLYLDGKLAQRTSTGTAAFRPSPLPLTLGANPTRNPKLFLEFFQGSIYQVRISKLVRYDSDFTPAKRWEPDTYTIALYHFDEGEGTVLKDSSGNGHDGEIVGAKWVKADGSPFPVAKQEPPPLAIAPFDAARAKEYQETWGKHLGLPVEAENKIGMKLILIPPASAALPKAFYLGKYEVTQGEWEKVMGYNPSAYGPEVAGMDTSKFPVERVSWYDSVEFCNKLSEWEGLKPFYELTVTTRSGNAIQEAEVKFLGGHGYHIPTKAEWEHGCRAGTRSKYHSGDNDKDLSDYAWYDQNSGDRPHSVGERKPNAFGLYDMHGNVNEWNDAIPTTAEILNPKSVVNRGGAWRWAASQCAINYRFAFDPKFPVSWKSASIGLRVARDPSGAASPEAKTPVPLAKQDPLPPTFKNSIGMEFVIVPKGKSWLGGGKDKLGDKEVEIPADFYLGKYEVTQEEWEKVMGENPSHFSRTGKGMDAVKEIPDADLKRFPVENMSWDQCQVFVAKLNQREKETGWVYRLPKEAEWEYACRGGPMADKADSAFDFYLAKPTNTLLPEQANFKDTGLNQTCKVGSYAPNKLGLFEMHGNAREWCDDTERKADSASLRMTRGGGYQSDSGNCRVAIRIAQELSLRQTSFGLRLARVPSGAPSPEVKTPLVAAAPFTDADVKRIAALPAAEQVEEVRKELMRRNPGFDGTVGNKIEDGVVTEWRINTDRVTDIAPIRVFTALRVLVCNGTYTDKPNGLLADLTPLEGMNLASLTHLNLDNTRVSDAGLASFQGCKNLVGLHLHATQVSDVGLAHFKNCKNLKHLNLDRTRVVDAGLAHFKECKNLEAVQLIVTRVSDAGLAHFKGMRLRRLRIYNTGITDLTPLQGMPLEDIRLTPKNIVKGLDVLRDMKSLKTIGIAYNQAQAWPAAEFWERYDKGEFTK